MWKDLSMQQRADLMDIYLSHGISSLDEMKNHYDSRNQFVEGGNLFDGTTQPTQQMNSGLNLYRRTNNLGETEYIYQETPDSEEILLTPTNKRFSDDPTNWDYKDASGREYSPRMVNPTSSSTLESSEKMEPLEKYVAELNWRVKNDPASIALQGKYTMPAVAAPLLAPLGEAFAGTTIAGVPATTWANTALAAGFAGHGLNHTINEGIDGWGDAAMTALELAPLGKLVRPMYEEVVQPGMRLFNSPLTGNWTKIGNREYRLNPNSLGTNGTPLESRGITPQITAENAASIAPEQWTAAQDAAIARGDMAEAQRLRDLHFNTKSSGSDTSKILYNHSTDSEPFYSFDLDRPTNHAGSTRNGKGVYIEPLINLSEEPDMAVWGRNFQGDWGSNNLKLRINFENPEIPIVDNPISTHPEGYVGRVEAFIRDPRKIKLDDAVTYDPVTGERIPLGKRDDFSKNNILWGLLPFGIGLTGYGLSQGNE